MHLCFWCIYQIMISELVRHTMHLEIPSDNWFEHKVIVLQAHRFYCLAAWEFFPKKLAKPAFPITNTLRLKIEMQRHLCSWKGNVPISAADNKQWILKKENPLEACQAFQMLFDVGLITAPYQLPFFLSKRLLFY
jgi:hypothetical protein